MGGGGERRLSASLLALIHVLLGVCVCVLGVSSGLFDGVETELGLESYAERPVAWLPRGLTLPANSLVNLGYLAVGRHWLARRAERRGQGEPGREWRDQYLSHVFGWMSALYGLVQGFRVYSQRHRAAVLDQWVTLPIFAWVSVWCLYLRGGWRPGLWLAVEAASLGTYLLALAWPRRGFELSLACHVGLAVVEGVSAQRREGDAVSRRWMASAILSCLGFVGLKVLDLWLGQWTFFRWLSGHFWSKVCDVLQIHFTFLFLSRLTARATGGKRGKEE